MAVGEDRFPLVSITGGPSGHAVLMTMDGVPMKGVTGFELTGGVRDVIRLKTFQIVRATVAIEAEHSHAVTVVVHAEKEKEREGKIVIVGEEQIATSTADTVWEALYDCARQLQLREGRSTQT